MMTLYMLLHQLDEEIDAVRFPEDCYLPIRGICNLSPGEQALEQDILYIVPRDACEQALSRWDGNGHRMLVTESGVVPESEFSENLYWFSVKLPCVQIGNRIMQEIFYYQQWAEKLGEFIGFERMHQDLRKRQQELMTCIADYSHFPILLMNRDFHLLASDVRYAAAEEHLQHISAEGILDADLAENFLNESEHLSLPVKQKVRCYGIASQEGRYVILCEVYERRTFLKQFFLVAKDSSKRQTLMDMACHIIPVIYQMFVWEKQGNSIVNEDDYTDFLLDLIEGRVRSEEEFQKRSERLASRIPSHYQIAVILADIGRSIPYKSLYRDLKKIMPAIDIVQHEQKLIILSEEKKGDYRNPLIEEQENLQKILEKYQAVMCIGGSSRFLAHVRFIYRQCASTLQVARRMVHGSGKRIFMQEDYHLQLLIHMCEEAVDQNFNGNYIYLCSKRYTALYRYDQENGSDLCQIIETYIANNYNTSQTAKVLYLHRNTLINKLTKIEEIIGGSLDDISIRNQMSLSSVIIRYVREVLNKDLFSVNPWQIEDGRE